MRDWTILTVNYNCSVYIYWQLKILESLPEASRIKLIIIDNSNEVNTINSYIKEIVTYLKVEIYKYSPKLKTASEQHGEGLDYGIKFVNTKFLLVQDPDFFWVKGDYISVLEELLTKNFCVGSPYPFEIGVGSPDYPAVWGAAFNLSNKEYISKNKKLSFRADATKEARQRSSENYGPLRFSYDVGWEIRRDFSDLPYVAFGQEEAKEQEFLFGSHSFEVVSREYSIKGKPIAYHLFRGSFTGHVTKTHEDPRAKLDFLTKYNRECICKYISKLHFENELYEKKRFKGLRRSLRNNSKGFMSFIYNRIMKGYYFYKYGKCRFKKRDFLEWVLAK